MTEGARWLPLVWYFNTVYVDTPIQKNYFNKFLVRHFINSHLFLKSNQFHLGRSIFEDRGRSFLRISIFPILNSQIGQASHPYNHYFCFKLRLKISIAAFCMRKQKHESNLARLADLTVDLRDERKRGRLPLSGVT